MRLSVEGFKMNECRALLMQWINSERSYENDTWANYCKNHWLNELGGLGSVW